jgi:Zn-finger nucleic acid-binding protein
MKFLLALVGSYLLLRAIFVSSPRKLLNYGTRINCPVCQSAKVILGRVTLGIGTQGNATEFKPGGQRIFAFVFAIFSPNRACPLFTQQTFKACTQCGHIWHSLDVTELSKVIKNYGTNSLKGSIRNLDTIPRKHINYATDINCPVCQLGTVIFGRVGNYGSEGGDAKDFIPNGLKFFRQQRSVPLFREQAFKACMQCGHVWDTLDATNLHRLIKNSGKEALKRSIQESSTRPEESLECYIPIERDMSSTKLSQQAIDYTDVYKIKYIIPIVMLLGFIALVYMLITDLNAP